ncbi:MAG: hypothetical protein ACTSR7_19795 [Promethearchaeota archaeon]
MSKEVKGLILSRLIVVILIIMVPLSTFLIYDLVVFSLWYSSDPVLNFWLIKIIIPLVYGISWIFFLILFANRLANALDSFNEKIDVVPSRMKFFYGINAIYLLIIFIFPLITPIISILSFASFAWRLSTYRKEDWEDDTAVSFFTKLLMAIFALVPIFCTISIIHQYLDLSIFLWNNIWIRILPYLFIFSYSLFTALAIGSLVILLSNSGISDYEQFYSYDPSKKQKFWKVKILEVFLFGLFLYMDVTRYLGIYNYDVVDAFYFAGFVIIIFTSIVNYVAGKSEHKDFKGHFLGYLVAIIFIGSNVIFSSAEISEFLRVWSLILSAVIYIFILAYTFLTSE